MTSPEFIRQLAKHHTPGQLSVAPEHSEPAVLELMKKPAVGLYERFADQFARAGRDQHLVAYFISGHPGCSLTDMVRLALWLKKQDLRPRQVQEFIPTPMSAATAMYYSGFDLSSGEPVDSPKGLRDKKLHKALLFYWDPAHHDDVREALRAAGRQDLIGSGPQALVPPARGKGSLPRHMRRAGGKRRK